MSSDLTGPTGSSHQSMYEYSTAVEVDHTPVADDEPGTYCVASDHGIMIGFTWNDHSGQNHDITAVHDLGSSEDCLEIEEEPTPTPTITPTPTPNVVSVTFSQVTPSSEGITQNPPVAPHNPGIGERIFPDDDVPGDLVDRRRVLVSATISPAVPNVTVYFRNFDLDDPTDDPVIDPNGTIGNDNNGTPFAGSLNAASALTNASGQASVEFTVTRQPGDNFAIAASTIEAQTNAVNVSGIELTNSGGANIPTTCSTEHVCRSQMLTVWRRLHLEVDRMGPALANFVRGTLTQTKKVATGNQSLSLSVTNLEENRFENRRLTIQHGSITRSLRVINSTFSPSTGTGPGSNTQDTVTINNNLGAFNINNGDLFTLYDDDDMNDRGIFDGDEGQPLQGPDTNLIQQSDVPCLDVFNANNCNVLTAAYVRPTYDLAGEDVGSFNANADDGLIESYRNLYFQNRPTEESESFWTAYLLAAYQYIAQGVGQTADGDPDEEGAVYGITDGVSANDAEGSVIFNELGRPREYADLDSFNNLPSWTMRPIGRRFTLAHEVGHLFGGGHQDHSVGTSNAGLMASSPVRLSPLFTSLTIRKIRGGSYTDVNGQTIRVTHP